MSKVVEINVTIYDIEYIPSDEFLFEKEEQLKIEENAFYRTIQ